MPSAVVARSDARFAFHVCVNQQSSDGYPASAAPGPAVDPPMVLFRQRLRCRQHLFRVPGTLTLRQISTIRRSRRSGTSYARRPCTCGRTSTSRSTRRTPRPPRCRRRRRGGCRGRASRETWLALHAVGRHAATSTPRLAELGGEAGEVLASVVQRGGVVLRVEVEDDGPAFELACEPSGRFAALGRQLEVRGLVSVLRHGQSFLGLDVAGSRPGPNRAIYHR